MSSLQNEQLISSICISFPTARFKQEIMEMIVKQLKQSTAKPVKLALKAQVCKPMSKQAWVLFFICVLSQFFRSKYMSIISKKTGQSWSQAFHWAGLTHSLWLEHGKSTLLTFFPLQLWRPGVIKKGHSTVGAAHIQIQAQESWFSNLLVG